MNRDFQISNDLRFKCHIVPQRHCLGAILLHIFKVRAVFFSLLWSFVECCMFLQKLKHLSSAIQPSHALTTTIKYWFHDSGGAWTNPEFIPRTIMIRSARNQKLVLAVTSFCWIWQKGCCKASTLIDSHMVRKLTMHPYLVSCTNTQTLMFQCFINTASHTRISWWFSM